MIHRGRVLFVAALLSAVAPDRCSATFDALCDGVRFATFAHPDDCRQYVVCFQGKPTVQRCPAGYVFNPYVLFCVQQSQYDCRHIPTSTPGPPEPEPSSTTEPSVAEELPTSTAVEPPGCTAGPPNWESFFCEDVRRALVPNPMNCTQYINCQSSPPSNSRCRPGTVFSDAYQDCLPGDGQACVMDPVCDQFCADRADGSYPHPYLCNRFLSCVRRTVRFESCPPFFVFNPTVRHCVTGNAVDCSSLLTR
ncbi:protein obstructor-E-like [Anopheles bellator]|uniref:protein obstructor-E-like n=1 Tax=Anopheles bellator TaxID=139047 RepID=UPI0026476F22|nr:protein obstructor-E-like [Anopheles bellator]